MNVKKDGPKKGEAPKDYKPPCERNCPLFDRFDNAKKTTVCCRFGSLIPQLRRAPAKSGYISCPDHPLYERSLGQKPPLVVVR